MLTKTGGEVGGGLLYQVQALGTWHAASEASVFGACGLVFQCDCRGCHAQLSVAVVMCSFSSSELCSCINCT